MKEGEVLCKDCQWSKRALTATGRIMYGKLRCRHRNNQIVKPHESCPYGQLRESKLRTLP